MEFGGFRTYWDQLNPKERKHYRNDLNVFYDVQDHGSKKAMEEAKAKGQHTQAGHILADGRMNWMEWRWYAKRRPYLRVWPGVETALFKSPRGIDPEHLPNVPCGALLVQFERSRWESCGLESALICTFPTNAEQTERAFGCVARTSVGTRVVTMCGERGLVSETPVEYVSRVPAELARASDPDAVYRLILGVCMASASPDIIEPDILPEDLEKYDAAREAGDEATMGGLTRRAASRGRNGFTLGRRFAEQNPHLRRAHLCHFHVDKGRTRTVYKLRAGSVVRRDKLGEVPTGYLDEQEGVDNAG